MFLSLLSICLFSILLLQCSQFTFGPLPRGTFGSKFLLCSVPGFYADVLESVPEHEDCDLRWDI